MKSLEKIREKDSTTCSCSDDPISCLQEMFVDLVQKGRVDSGQCPARRPVFLRTHGILTGTMKFRDDIPESYRKGLWDRAGSEHPVYIRFSSDLADGRPDWESTIGVGIKIFNIPGEKLVTDNGKHTADLLLQNAPNFFVDNATEMCGFTKAGLEGWSDEWIQKNSPKTSAILENMKKPIRSVFGTQLWSVVPFKLGASFCKYIVKPGTSTFAEEPDIHDPDFLGKDLAARLTAGDATINVFIQKQPSSSEYGQPYIDEHYPLDRATVIWDETEATPVHVATIHIPQQDINDAEQKIFGDWLAFNIGRVPNENSPVGSIAEARMKVYQASADFRRDKNSQPVEEPEGPGAPTIQNPQCPFDPSQPTKEQPRNLTEDEINRITHARIHPGIGIMRVGNSQTDTYIGPETLNPPRTSWSGTRDAGGAIKRQTARFRVYGYDKYNNVVAEIHQSDTSDVEWSAHVCNKKAWWYEFQAAMDIPATQSLTVPLRNADISGEDRDALIIDGGETVIQGVNMKDDSYSMNGEFQGTSVYLGELRTDEVGRLLVVPGHGVSASPTGKPVFDPSKPSTFNNAAGWYDDICDGPIHAKITLGGRTIVADPAWVCSAPPAYAPDLKGWRTLDDLMREVFISAGMQALPNEISFNKDVRPILARLNELQWVNKGFSAMFGAGAPMNFSDPELLKRLSHAPTSSLYPDPYEELRRTIYNSFRKTYSTNINRSAWPWIYGDTFGYTNPNAPTKTYARTYLQLPELYDHILKKWVSGDFINDLDLSDKERKNIDELPLQERPEQLDRSAVAFCLADAFHPGCELTWPIRHASMYRAPYRIREREPGKNDPEYGASLSADQVRSMDGPLYEQSPGDLTRWMALPWQGDTAFCRSGYDMEYDPYTPTFWPARVPNNVLTKTDYDTLMDKDKPVDVRIAAFKNRPLWLRQLTLSDSPPQQMEHMVEHFGEMGILEALPRPEDMDWLPEFLYVENLTEVKLRELEIAQKLFYERYGELGFHNRLLAEAGWFNEEQRNEFATIKSSVLE